MIEEDADAAEFFAGREQDFTRPTDAEWPAWSGWIREAWRALSEDRFYGAMGGVGRVYFTAKDAYAARFGIVGEAFEHFLILFDALDDVYVEFTNDQAREKARSEHADHDRSNPPDHDPGVKSRR